MKDKDHFYTEVVFFSTLRKPRRSLPKNCRIAKRGNIFANWNVS